MKKKFKEFTKEWFAEQGRLGGEKTKKLYGTTHYSSINPKKKKKDLSQEQAEKEQISEVIHK